MTHHGAEAAVGRLRGHLSTITRAGEAGSDPSTTAARRAVPALFRSLSLPGRSWTPRSQAAGAAWRSYGNKTSRLGSEGTLQGQEAAECRWGCVVEWCHLGFFLSIWPGRPSIAVGFREAFWDLTWRDPQTPSQACQGTGLAPGRTAMAEVIRPGLELLWSGPGGHHPQWCPVPEGCLYLVLCLGASGPGCISAFLGTHGSLTTSKALWGPGLQSHLASHLTPATERLLYLSLHLAVGLPAHFHRPQGP